MPRRPQEMPERAPDERAIDSYPRTLPDIGEKTRSAAGSGDVRALTLASAFGKSKVVRVTKRRPRFPPARACFRWLDGCRRRFLAEPERATTALPAMTPRPKSGSASRRGRIRRRSLVPAGPESALRRAPPGTLAPPPRPASDGRDLRSRSRLSAEAAGTVARAAAAGEMVAAVVAAAGEMAAAVARAAAASAAAGTAAEASAAVALGVRAQTDPVMASEAAEPAVGSVRMAGEAMSAPDQWRSAPDRATSPVRALVAPSTSSRPARPGHRAPGRQSQPRVLRPQTSGTAYAPGWRASLRPPRTPIGKQRCRTAARRRRRRVRPLSTPPRDRGPSSTGRSPQRGACAHPSLLTVPHLRGRIHRGISIGPRDLAVGADQCPDQQSTVRRLSAMACSAG